MDNFRNSGMILMASAAVAGLVTVVVWYFCAGGDKSKGLKTDKKPKSKVSVVQPFMQHGHEDTIEKESSHRRTKPINTGSGCHSSKMGNNQSENQDNPTELEEDSETNLDTGNTNIKKDNDSENVDIRCANNDDSVVKMKNNVDSNDTISDCKNDTNNLQSGNKTANQTDNRISGSISDKKINNQTISGSGREGDNVLGSVQMKSQNVKTESVEEINPESSAGDLNAIGNNQTENSHKPLSTTTEEVKRNTISKSTENAGNSPCMTMNANKNILGDLNDNNNKTNQPSGETYLQVTQNSRALLSNSKEINNSEIDPCNNKGSLEYGNNTRGCERLDMSGSDKSIHSQKEDISYAQHCTKEVDGKLSVKNGDSSYGILTEGGMKVQSIKNMDTTQVKTTSDMEHDNESMDTELNMDEKSVGITRKTRKSTKRNAVIVQNDDNIFCDKEVIKQWIKTEEETLLNTVLANNEDSSDNTRIFCKKLSENCKVIITPKLNNENDQQVVTSDNYEMINHSCQTEIVCDLGQEKQINNDEIKDSKLILEKLQLELNAYKVREKSDNEKLTTALSEISHLKEENSRLQVLLQKKELQDKKTEENNNFNHSEPTHQKYANSVQKSTKVQQLSSTHNDGLSKRSSETVKSQTGSSDITGQNETFTAESKITKHKSSEIESVPVIATQSELLSNKPTVNTCLQADIHVVEDESTTKESNALAESLNQEESSTEDLRDGTSKLSEYQNQVQNTTDVSNEEEEDHSKNLEYETDEESLGSICDKNMDHSDGSPSNQDLRIVESGDEESEHNDRTDSVVTLDDLSLTASPSHKDSCGFSFDDILRANLEYLSDEDDDLFQNNLIKEAEDEIKYDHQNDSDEYEQCHDNSDLIDEQETVQDKSEEKQEEEAECKVLDSTKFWENKLTALSKDKCVSDQNIDLNSEAIGNIQKTKQKWEEIVVTANSTSSKRRSLDGSEGNETKTGEFEDEAMLSNVQQSKLKWQEMMSSGQNSGCTSSRRRSLEELNGSSLSGSDLEESFGAASNILQKRLLWEGMNTSQQNLAGNDSDSCKRMTLDINSTLEKADVSKAKMKFEELMEIKDSPQMPRRNVRLVSKTEEELEAEFMSSDVMLQSIADVSNTKSKWEKLFSGENDESNQNNGKTVVKPKIKKVDSFVSLREKFETTGNGEEQEPVEDDSEC